MSETNRIEYKQELMRIYRDLELVEQLGSGVPRILEHYDRSCFKFFPNFIRMIFPKMIGGQVGVHIRYIVNFLQCPIKFTI